MNNKKTKPQNNSKGNSKKYSQDDVYKALQMINDGTSQRKVSEMFNIPRSTLQAKHSFTIPAEAARGPSTYLTNDEETQIVQWIFYCGERGFPVTKAMLQQCVKKFITNDGRVTPFKDNMLGKKWYRCFLSRHPEITTRVCQNLSTSRVSATEEVLKEWFCVLSQKFEELNLVDIDPSRVFNLDESAFFLIPKGDKVLARKSSRSVYKVVSGDEKESITVLFNVNASGTMVPPLILYWYERMPQNIIRSILKNWFVGNSDTGWMTVESFLEYIKSKFLLWIIKNNIERTIILFVDGHVSHMNLELSIFCRENGIHLVALYPNATHILQPLDVAVFHPLKDSWKREIDEWRYENQFQKLKKEQCSIIEISY